MSDILAVSRTHMANERTLLAYLNTFLAMTATAVALIKFTNDITFVNIGFVLLGFAVLVPVVGIFRFFRIKKMINDNKPAAKEIGTDPGDDD